MSIRAVLLSVVSGFALVACADPDPEIAPLLSIPEGAYDAQIGAACAVLEFGRRDRDSYLLDANCDGAAEVESRDVAVVESTIQVPGAVMTVTAVGPASFSGVWSADGAATEVRFVRRDDRR